MAQHTNSRGFGHCIEQCRATRAFKRRFGVKNALDYPVGEKLRMFAQLWRIAQAKPQPQPQALPPVNHCHPDVMTSVNSFAGLARYSSA